MNFKSFVLFSFVSGIAVGDKSDACLSCSDTCALVPPPDKQGFPCYEGAIKDAKICYETDPLLAEGTTWQCGTCEAAGYDTYLQNDPIYKNMELWSASKAVTKKDVDPTACQKCSASDTCALVPPSDKPGFPCYQGSVQDSKVCYNTDPLLAEGTTWQCGTCEAAGYDTYLQNDPIYKNMELWSASKTVTKKDVDPTACLKCFASQTCALVPPSDKPGFPCYQGSIKDSNICYNTDPLLAEGTTWQCGTCEAAGFNKYLRNDPIYENMELWFQKPFQKNSTV